MKATYHDVKLPNGGTMKKILIATTALTLMCGSAFAQGTTGPAGQQDNMVKPGTTNGSMEKG